jgi:hypothetical protein
VGYCTVRSLIVLYTCLTVSCVLVLGSVIRFMIVYSLYLLLLLCVFSILHCLIHCFSLCIFVPFYLCAVYGPLPLGDIPVAVNKYHSFIIHSFTCPVHKLNLGICTWTGTASDMKTHLKEAHIDICVDLRDGS